MRGAAGLRRHRRPAHGEKDAACPGCVASELGEAARGEAAGPRCDRRPTHDRRRSSAQGAKRPWGKLRSVKRPACFQRQTGACRSCGLAVSQLCRGHEDPVEATDLSATGRRTPTDQVRTKHRARSVPGVQRQERSTPTRRTGVQRAKDQRQTPTAGLGPRTESYVKSAGSIRAACEGPTSNSASAAFPRGRPGESESSSGRTRATGITHPGFYGRKPWKKPNSAVIITARRPAKEGLGDPFGKLPPNRSQNLTTNPSHPRPSYRHRSPKLSLFRRSRFLIARRVS